MRVAVPENSRYDDWLFANDTALMPAQWPSTGLWDYDNVTTYAVVPAEAFSQLADGYVGVAVPASLKAGSPVLALWSSSNEITHTSDITIEAGGIRFTHKFTPHKKMAAAALPS